MGHVGADGLTGTTMKNLYERNNISIIALTVFLFFSPIWVSNLGVMAEEGAISVFNQKISLDLRDIDVNEALKFLASKTGLNIIATKGVAGRVTLIAENVAIQDIFDIILRSNGLAYDRKGEIYNVMTEQEYKAIYGKNFFDPRQVKIFHLTYAIPDQVFTLLDAMKSDMGRVLVDPESGNVLVMDTALKIQDMQMALVEFEKKNLVEVFTLKYAKAKEVEEVLKTQLDAKKVGFVKADERSNKIIVQTLPERMREVARLISYLDSQTKEVLIDTKIIKIKLSDQLDSGMEWEGLFEVATRHHGLNYLGSYPFSAVQASSADWRSRKEVWDDLGNSVGSYPFSGTTSSFASSTKLAPGEGLHFGTVYEKRDFDILFKFLQTLGNTRILSNPKIVVISNQEAKIHIGERQAYITQTTTTGQTTSTIAEEVQFVDVGIQLSVTPIINDDGYITMKIKPEISSVISTLITPTNNRIPIIDTSLTETTVLIKDGTTLIIGGLRKEEKTADSSGVPVLGRIPFLGYFFKSSTAKTERTELLIMLTPHIVSGNILSTGNERFFTNKAGKEYRDYSYITPEREKYSSDVPADIQPKGYRDLTVEKKEEIKYYRYYEPATKADELELIDNKPRLGSVTHRDSTTEKQLKEKKTVMIKETKSYESSAESDK